MLGKDDDFALPSSGVTHLGVVLENLRQLIHLAVLAGPDDRLCLLLQPLEIRISASSSDIDSDAVASSTSVSSSFSCSSALRSSSSSGTAVSVRPLSAALGRRVFRLGDDLRGDPSDA